MTLQHPINFSFIIPSGLAFHTSLLHPDQFLDLLWCGQKLLRRNFAHGQGFLHKLYLELYKEPVGTLELHFFPLNMERVKLSGGSLTSLGGGQENDEKIH